MECNGDRLYGRIKLLQDMKRNLVQEHQDLVCKLDNAKKKLILKNNSLQSFSKKREDLLHERDLLKGKTERLSSDLDEVKHKIITLMDMQAQEKQTQRLELIALSEELERAKKEADDACGAALKNELIALEVQRDVIIASLEDWITHAERYVQTCRWSGTLLHWQHLHQWEGHLVLAKDTLCKLQRHFKEQLQQLKNGEDVSSLVPFRLPFLPPVPLDIPRTIPPHNSPPPVMVHPNSYVHQPSFFVRPPVQMLHHPDHLRLWSPAPVHQLRQSFNQSVPFLTNIPALSPTPGTLMDRDTAPAALAPGATPTTTFAPAPANTPNPAIASDAGRAPTSAFSFKYTPTLTIAPICASGPEFTPLLAPASTGTFGSDSAPTQDPAPTSLFVPESTSTQVPATTFPPNPAHAPITTLGSDLVPATSFDPNHAPARALAPNPALSPTLVPNTAHSKTTPPNPATARTLCSDPVPARTIPSDPAPARTLAPASALPLAYTPASVLASSPHPAPTATPGVAFGASSGLALSTGPPPDTDHALAIALTPTVVPAPVLPLSASPTAHGHGGALPQSVVKLNKLLEKLGMLFPQHDRQELREALQWVKTSRGTLTGLSMVELEMQVTLALACKFSQCIKTWQSEDTSEDKLCPFCS